VTRHGSPTGRPADRDITAVADVQALAAAMLDQVERAVVGKRRALELVLLGLLADGHVLLDDYPGLAKTLIARSFAQVTRLRFARVQFTPDLMPSDVTGSSVYNQRLADFEFRPGPVFTNLLLGDEINRSPPKTQAALLEAMQERQVTIDGVTHPLERPFLVIATQNPIEYEGTYPLPEAQLDRFLLRLSIGYPSPEAEWRMVSRRLERASDEVRLDPVATPADLLAAQRAIEQVHVGESVGRYMVELVAATRASPRVQVGASPRGTLALLKAARANAAVAGRDFVTPEDVKAVAVPALAHRLILRPELWVRRVRTEDVVAELLDRVPTPAALPDLAPLPVDNPGSPRATSATVETGGPPSGEGAVGVPTRRPGRQQRTGSQAERRPGPASAPEPGGQAWRRGRG
jgi:MoxR-like ATPase